MDSVLEMGAKGSGSGGNLKTGNGSVWHGSRSLRMGASESGNGHISIWPLTMFTLGLIFLLQFTSLLISPLLSSFSPLLCILCYRHLLFKHTPIPISPLTQSEISSPLFLPLFLPQFSPFFLPIPSPLPFAPLPARGMVRAYPRSLGCTD